MAATKKASASRKSTGKKAATKKAAPAKRAAAPKQLDAIALLRQDHERVLEMLGTLENATGTRREKLLATIEQELKVHTTIEEEIFYPAYREAARKKEDRKLYFEAVQEHGVVDMFMPEMSSGQNPDELKAKAKVLKDLVEHHIEEEQNEMFPRAKKVLDREELRELGARMQSRKERLMAR